MVGEGGDMRSKYWFTTVWLVVLVLKMVASCSSWYFTSEMMVSILKSNQVGGSSQEGGKREVGWWRVEVDEK